MHHLPIDRSLTLQQLENSTWKPEPMFMTSLIKRCTKLYWEKPLNKYTIEDLQVMLSQQFSPAYLVPIALEHVEENPWIEGRYYPGDLLFALLSLPHSVWEQHPDYHYSLEIIIDKLDTFFQDFQQPAATFRKYKMES